MSVCRLELSGSSVPFKIWVSAKFPASATLPKINCLSLPKTANNLPKYPQCICPK